MPLRRMKQKKYTGVYELVNGKGLVTGYYINYRDLDGVSRKTRVDANNPADAALELKQKLVEINKIREEDEHTDLSLRMGNANIEKIAYRYFDTLKNGTKPKQSFKLYLTSVGTKRRVKEEDVKRIQIDLQKRDLSNKTVNGATDLLRSVLNFGVKNGYMPYGTYVMHKYEKLQVDNLMSVEAVLDGSQVREMFKRSLLTSGQMENPSQDYEPSFAKHRLQMFLKMLYFTGQRPQSILQLQVRDIQDGKVRIATIKKQGAHYVSVAKELSPHLATWTKDMGPDDYLFGSEYDKSKHISYDSIVETARDLFGHYNKGKTFKKDRSIWISFYTLRHSAATNLLASSGNIRGAQQLLNHSDIKITERYAKMLESQLEDLVNVL